MLKLKTKQSEPKEFLTPIQSKLVKILSKNGALTRREFVNQLQKPRTTIYDNLLKLHNQKVVEKYSKSNGMRGRPLVFWKLSPN